MPQPLPIRSVNHVARTTSRLEESRRFYRDVLGFREVKRPNFDFPGAWLHNYGLMIHLIAGNGSEKPAGEIDTRADHLALHVDDLPAAARRLEELGIRYRANQLPDGGLQQIFFHDPDGHHVELGTYPPTPPYMD
jgi:catechol 2,3-dioxygenase-like lactoylglutathione lyase family enzyme